LKITELVPNLHQRFDFWSCNFYRQKYDKK
jgi:hypothetical protein